MTSGSPDRPSISAANSPDSGDSDPTLYALFPTLVYQAALSNATGWKTLMQECLPDHNFNSSVQQGGQHFAGEYHGQILLHQDERLSPFFSALAIQVAAYLKVLGMKPELFDIQCLKSWFVVCNPIDETASENASASLLCHDHSCSDVSWVYYVDVPDDCPAITFHSGRTPATEPFGSAFHYDWQHEEKSSVTTFNQWNRDTWSIVPKEGDLMLFPGHQLHSVEANHTRHRRLSVAGDLALTLKSEFIDREFGRTSPQHWKTLPLK